LGVGVKKKLVRGLLSLLIFEAYFDKVGKIKKALKW